MLEYAGSQRAGLRAEREAPRLLAVVRSLDWILLAGVAAPALVGLGGDGGRAVARALGLVARGGRGEVGRSERPELLPQPPDPLRVRGGGRARGGRADRPGSLTAALAPDICRAPP